jgi:hypothetical protein
MNSSKKLYSDGVGYCICEVQVVIMTTEYMTLLAVVPRKQNT